MTTTTTTTETARAQFARMIRAELATRYDVDASPHWIDEAWNFRAEHWEETLGEDLRQIVCLPAAQGEELYTQYRDAWRTCLEVAGISRYTQIDLGLRYLPDAITVAAVDTQKVNDGIKKGQKLTRWIANYLKSHEGLRGLIGEESTAKLAETFPGLLQDTVRKTNGKLLKISAHPWDLLTTSDFTTGWSSCHRWLDSGIGEYCSGNFGYLFSANTLVVSIHKPDDTTRSSSGDPVARKLWRQMVLVADDRSKVWFSREYPNPISEFQHAFIRDKVCELIAGKPNPPRTLKRDGEEQFCSDSAYADCVRVSVDLSPDSPVKPQLYNVIIPAPVCPCCNSDHENHSRPLCDDCDPQGRSACACCGERCRAENLATVYGGDEVCEVCRADHYVWSELMDEYIHNEDAISIGDDYATERYLQRNGYWQCHDCDEWHYPDDNQHDVDGNSICESCINNYTFCPNCETYHR